MASETIADIYQQENRAILCPTCSADIKQEKHRSECCNDYIHEIVDDIAQSGISLEEITYEWDNGDFYKTLLETS